MEQLLIIFSPVSAVSLQCFQKSELYTKCQNFNIQTQLSLDKVNNNNNKNKEAETTYPEYLRQTSRLTQTSVIGIALEHLHNELHAVSTDEKK